MRIIAFISGAVNIEHVTSYTPLYVFVMQV
jgi:hypothetical protein